MSLHINHALPDAIILRRLQEHFHNLMRPEPGSREEQAVADIVRGGRTTLVVLRGLGYPFTQEEFINAAADCTPINEPGHPPTAIIADGVADEAAAEEE